MENSRKGENSEGQKVNPRVGVHRDAQEAAQSDAIDRLFLRLDMRAALPQGAGSPKSRDTKADPGGKGTAQRHKVAARRQAPSIRKKARKTASRKRNTPKYGFLKK